MLYIQEPDHNSQIDKKCVGLVVPRFRMKQLSNPQESVTLHASDKLLMDQSS